MTFEKEKIKKRFSEIDEALSEIKKLVSLPEKAFWAEKNWMAAVKYYLLQAIEAVGGVCVHVAAKKFNKGVSVFGECFEILAKEGVFDEKLTNRLRRMVKFRNKLIHKYWEIDDKKVFEYAKNNQSDFGVFMKKISRLL